MSENVFNVLKLVGLVVAIGGFGLVSWQLLVLLGSWAEKNKSSKISSRIFDAIEKLKMVTSILTSNAFDALTVETKKAFADGVITNDEFAKIVASVSADVIKTLKTEIPTLTKYFLGDNLEDFIKNLVKKYIVDYAKEKLGVANIPLPK